MLPNKKSSILLVLKTLEEYTDENHYLTQNEIAEKIRINFDIELERKSIGTSLQLLEELDYDIAKGNKGGFALLSRVLDETEATFLIDAVFSSKSIDGRMAKRIANQVASCFSKYQRKDYSYIYKSSEISRTNNKDVLYNISIIHEAIKLGKRVGFKLLGYDESGNAISRRDGFQYIVSPYYLINNFGRYYLLCNYREKYRPLQIFRIDYMYDIEIKHDWNIKRISDLKDGPKDFSISKYINNHIYMLGGDLIEATLVLDDAKAIRCIKDWFGERAKIIKEGDEIKVYVTCNENALYYWVLQYSDRLKVISPESFVNRIKEGLKETLKRYE